MNKHFIYFLVLFFSLTGCQDTGFEPKGVDSKTSDAASLLPGDARVLAMMDVKNAFENLDIPGLARQDVESSFSRLTDLTGIDPAKDVNDVYVALSGNNDSGEGSLVVFADFDSARIVSFIQNEAGSDVTKSVHNGIDTYCATHSENDNQKEMCLALVDSELILASSSAEGLRGMLDRHAGSGGGAMQNADLASLLDHTGGQTGAWLIVHGVDQFPDPGDDIDAAISGTIGLLKDVVLLTEYSSSSIDVTLKAFPQNASNLSDLASIIEGAVSAARLAVKDEENASELRDMLDGVEVTQLDNYLAIRGAVPKSVLTRVN